jgi:thiamine-monophosphate kinase
VLLGIGDDAAWVANPFRSSLVTSDLLIEGIHFNLKWTSLFDLGYKTLAVNLSDIAAMGGMPAYLILSLGIPPAFDSRDIEEFYRGIRSLAAKHGVALVGGDTNAAKLLIISACVLGHARNRPIRRSGAQAGDDIYVTGTLGDSALALKFLKTRPRQPNRGPVKYFLSRHHRPTPRVTAGALLARQRLATAMIDVSDGLIQDLGHICEASGIGAQIWQDRLPLSRAYRKLAGTAGTRYALCGGEDYELLFCARKHDRRRIEKLQTQARLVITRIGSCDSGKNGIVVLDAAGHPVETRAAGHDHFKK